MCMCDKPTINGQPGYRWNSPEISIRPVNPPELQEGEDLLTDDPGRCGGQDSHSHHYRLVASPHGGTLLLVRHGGGDERIRLSGPITKPLAVMESNARYWILNTIYHAHADAGRKGRDTEAQRWRKAAAEDRIKTRKVRLSSSVKVWIEEAN